MRRPYVCARERECVCVQSVCVCVRCVSEKTVCVCACEERVRASEKTAWVYVSV